MQRLIAISWIKGDINEVHRLQKQLIASYAARLLAVRRVISNSGHKTPGVDGVVWTNYEELMTTVDNLKNLSNYQSSPVKRIYIPKAGSDEKRPLGIPTIYDRSVQALIYMALIPIAECRADLRSFGFRPYRSTRDVMQYLQLLISKKSYCWVLEADIEKCFDRISHEWILNNVPLPKHLLKQVLKSGVIDAGVYSDSEIGTPQGGIISPTLANYCLDGIEALIPEKCWLVRYADDFIVVAKSKEILENEVKPLLLKFLEERGLKIKEAKTKITNVIDGFDFLGFNIRTYLRVKSTGKRNNTILLIKPSKNKVIKFKEKLRNVIKTHGNGKLSYLISNLNPILIGWANYYNSVVSSRVFKGLSTYTWHLLWKWLTRKYPHARVRDLLKLFQGKIRGNNFVFQERDEKGVLWRLFQIGWVRIVRHSLCKLSANIFLVNEEDLEAIRKKAVPGISENKRKIWNKQKGLCPVCECSLLEDLPLEVHHILPRKLGGKNVINNLILIHKTCHNIITYCKDPVKLETFYNKGIIKKVL